MGHPDAPAVDQNVAGVEQGFGLVLGELECFGQEIEESGLVAVAGNGKFRDIHFGISLP